MNIKKHLKGKVPLMFEHFEKVTPINVADREVRCNILQTCCCQCKKFYKYISVFSL